MFLIQFFMTGIIGLPEHRELAKLIKRHRVPLRYLLWSITFISLILGVILLIKNSFAFAPAYLFLTVGVLSLIHMIMIKTKKQGIYEEKY